MSLCFIISWFLFDKQSNLLQFRSCYNLQLTRSINNITTIIQLWSIMLIKIQPLHAVVLISSSINIALLSIVSMNSGSEDFILYVSSICFFYMFLLYVSSIYVSYNVTEV